MPAADLEITTFEMKYLRFELGQYVYAPEITLTESLGGALRGSTQSSSACRTAIPTYSAAPVWIDWKCRRRGPGNSQILRSGAGMWTARTTSAARRSR